MEILENYDKSVCYGDGMAVAESFYGYFSKLN
jgi:hypothetical protein